MKASLLRQSSATVTKELEDERDVTPERMLQSLVEHEMPMSFYYVSLLCRITIFLLRCSFDHDYAVGCA
jgi:hypothetical protein